MAEVASAAVERPRWNLMASLLYGVTAQDPLTFAAVALLPPHYRPARVTS
jgi:hypothetical protein